MSDLKGDHQAYGVEDVALEKRDTSPQADFEPATAKEQAAVIRKLDMRLLPFVLVLYTLSVLDRSNLGNAKLAGMAKDIDLTGYKYNWLGTMFYIAYILFQWTMVGWKQFKPHNWAACVVFFWGFVASIQAAVHNWGGLMTCRFFLGIAESTFGPGVPLYLSFFYPRDKVGFRHGVFISGAALANAYGSALAYGITKINGSLAPWRILFLIEGLPTCCVAFAAWLYLPDSITTARFLNEREKHIATHMVARNQTLDEGHKAGIRLHELLEAFKDPKSYIPAVMYFSVNVSYASLPLFVPTIIDDLGTFTTIQSQGLSAPPYLLCFFVILIVSYLTDKVKMRGPFITAAATVAGIGFILLGSCTSTPARYLGVFLAIEIFVCVSLILSWVANIHATESKRAGGYTILATVGQCGPLLGTNVFPATEGPYFRKGMWISCGFCLLVAVLSVVLTLWLRMENQKMEREGLLDHENEEGEIRDDTGSASHVKKFRYIL